MNSAIERLLSLRVADVMSRQVQTVTDCDTMLHAAEKLLAHDISAAPVVDVQERLVGMLTATDFMRWEREQSDESATLSPGGQELTRHGGDTAYALESVPTECVARHMSKCVQAVAADVSLLDACRMMCRAHVHRLPVTDSHGAILGIVSTLDMVAAMVAAVEE